MGPPSPSQYQISSLKHAAVVILAIITFFQNSSISCRAFVPSSTLSNHRHTIPFVFPTNTLQIKTPLTTLSSSPSPSSSSDDDEKPSELNSMRKALESSWDGDLMGILPSTPEKGAAASANAIASAVKDGSSVVRVDVLLPSYDITQGPNRYDETLAVDFCIQLAENLKSEGVTKTGRSAILLKDAESERNVKRILEMKAQKRGDSATEVEEEEKKVVGEDVDTYRAQLLSSWDDDDYSSTNSSVPTSPSANYRIGSLLGDAYISKGPDMFDEVIEAVDEYAARDTDDALVILSAVSPAEMIAVRRIVATLEGKKTIVLVNCKFTNVPIELRRSVMAYSILPLLARPKVNTGGFSGTEGRRPADGGGGEEGLTKIVLLRRYPKDWELFVDISGKGNGFELAGSVAAEGIIGSGKTPSMEWIGGCVKRHMEIKFRQ